MGTTLELSPVEEVVITDCLLGELREMANDVAETVKYEPIEPGHAEDARWKVERMAVCLGLLEQFRYVEPSDGRTYAGVLVPKAETDARVAS